MTTNSVLSGISNLILPERNASPLDLNGEQNIVICLYKSLSAIELERLKKYGKVVELDDSYLNVDCRLFEFDYLVIDFRNTDYRIYFQKYIMKKEYRLLLIRHSFETNNGIPFHNELTCLPTEQALKKDFDLLLFLEELPSPKCYISFFRSCIFGKAQVQI